MTTTTTPTIAIVGASLAGLQAAETLRAQGHEGRIVMIGDEPYEPYDRPPLSKGAAHGDFPASHATLPRRFTRGAGEVEWRLGVAATALDPAARVITLADGSTVDYDRVLIATGTRARPWFNPEEAALDGVVTLRGRDDATDLATRLAARPKRVVVIGSGFTGSELASACRQLDLPVTVVERADAPLVAALGAPIGEHAAALQHAHGVDLRCGTTVTHLEGDSQGRFRRAVLADGTSIDADLAIVALGAVRNVEWLTGSGLAFGAMGIACDTGCRVFGENMMVREDVFAAGDIARFPHPLYEHSFVALDHWSNAVDMATVAAHNMICPPEQRTPHLPIPSFWSNQFGVTIKSIGVPSAADQIVITQGSPEHHRFVAVYGARGRIVGAVAFDQGRYLNSYERMIADAAPFPPEIDAAYPMPIANPKPVPTGFPDRAQTWAQATAVLTGYDALARDVRWIRPEPATA
jgi:NADPH-dependent 2,4-dienoyl-CoA reductase/sulfur reductase-like enzyme